MLVQQRGMTRLLPGANDEEILSVNMSAVLVVRVSVEHNTLSLSPFVPVSASSWL